MVEVTIDSIRVSLMSQHRVAILKDEAGERYLPIWIGPSEADAITVELQDIEMARPLTHDVLQTTIADLGAAVSHIVIRDLRNDVFYALIVLDQNGQKLEIDSRPSDAMALAVRVRVPIFVADEVMDEAGIVPERDMEEELESVDDASLSAFSDFVESLEIDEPDENPDD